MSYLSLKYLHILSMVLLFGTGLGSAFYKWMADRSGNLAHIAVMNRHVVLADWLFTTPTVIFQPISGLWMVYLLHYPLTTPWIMLSLVLYALAGACWLPVVWLQIQMRRLSEHALATQTELPTLYWRYARYWFWLGVPAFIAMILIVLLMVFKFTGGV
ncbi:DUF2269 domain-containing protein [uncultured Thiothrix sp.]|uniref:DUF2269 family protein n=1 Tax=uncultured Thiothrix sp. TaxID=223185 RepID=UPI00262F6E72|nr:DUF2269 domain-containing protein [uncultured Thiothrix sp.]